MSQERAAWFDAVKIDPLLPERILPANYLGQKAWRERVQAIVETARETASHVEK